MSNSEVVRPRLYEDVDGVLLPFGRSPFEMRDLNELESYAPEVVRRLGSTCLELVWCTTWDKASLDHLVEQMDAMRDGRQLPLDRPRGIAQKLHAIIADQEQSPSPFVWADDAITESEREEVERRFGDRAHLLIQPDKNVGYDEIQLASIENFAHEWDPALSSETK